MWGLVDAWYWSGREAVPFAPGPGRGFEQPGIVDPVESSWEPQEFFAAAAHTDPSSTYVSVACNFDRLFGFHSEQISGVGRPPRIVQPRSYEVYERFVGVVPGRAIGPASDIASEIRAQLFDEDYVTLRGTVVGPTRGDEIHASVILSRGTGAMSVEDRSPWTQVIVAADGTYSARVPARDAYFAELIAFGRTVDSAETVVGTTDATLPAMSLTAPGSIELDVTVDGLEDHALVFVHPADDATRGTVTARLFDSVHRLRSVAGCAPTEDRRRVSASW